MKPIKIFIVDDHPALRNGIANVVNSQEDMIVCGEAGTIEEAKRGIKKHKPDMAIIDISLNGEDGFDLIDDLRQYPNLSVIIVSMYDEVVFIQKAFRTGARGYIHKSEELAQYPNAIRRVVQGDFYWSRSLAPQMQIILTWEPYQDISIDTLTVRETEIFKLFGQQKRRKEIASELSIDLKTVNAHIDNIKNKLGLSLNQLNQRARDWIKNYAK